MQRTVLLAKQSEVNMVDQFAKYAKIQRQINAIDQELQELQGNRRNSSLIWDIALKYALKIPFAVLLVIFSIYYRDTPAFVVDKSFDLFPFGNIIAYPSKERNSVSLHFWIMCCTAFFRVIKFN